MKVLELLVLFIISTASSSPDLADYTKLCSLFSKNTKIRLPGSCVQYIECNGETGEIISCPENTKYNKETGKCVENLDTTKFCENPCKGVEDGYFVAKPTSCRACYYCENGVAFESSCSQQYYFDQSVGKGECVYPKDSNCTMDMVNNICEHVKDGTMFRDETDCSLYKKCANNKQIKGDCKDKKGKIFYFNVENGKCEERANVPCNAHTIPENLCFNKKPIVGLVPDGFSCRGYFICADKGKHAHDLLPRWTQCPRGKYFDSSSKSCVDPWDIKCPYNRCDGYGDRLATSEQNNCRNYYVCKNDRNVTEIACDIDYFFDERQQKCVRDIIYYNSCDQKDTH